MIEDLFLAVQVALLVTGTLVWLVVLGRGLARVWLAPKPPFPRWSIALTDFLSFAFILIGVVWGASFVSALLFHLDFAMPFPIRTLLIQATATQFGALIACLLIRLHPQGRPADGAMPLRRAAAAGVLGFLLLAPVISAVLAAWYAALQAMGIEPVAQELVDALARTGDPTELAATVLLAVVVAPITEELVFRRGLLRFLLARWPAGWAVGVSSLIFAAIHGKLLAAVPIFVLGCALSLVYMNSGRVLAPIVLHACFNLQSVILVLVSGNSS